MTAPTLARAHTARSSPPPPSASAACASGPHCAAARPLSAYLAGAGAEAAAPDRAHSPPRVSVDAAFVAADAPLSRLAVESLASGVGVVPAAQLRASDLESLLVRRQAGA